MQLRAPAILIAVRPHGETAVIARLLTEEYGLVAGYVAGGRGRNLRPVVIPGNLVAVDLRAKSDSQLPFAKLELLESRGPWLSEPLPAAAIQWVTALTATALPERNPYPSLYNALKALLEAICQAPSARGWAPALLTYETLLLRELGYGGAKPEAEGLADILAAMEKLADPLQRYLLADRFGDTMAAREQLIERLRKMV
ncbi:DNA repair protein RecO [Parerythrobacter jejuensis]|uniref:DNA repair protein RecO n=1 Tax=Parerythrobacter jejuensis TaxID=795812 RepID=A0A845AW91_9SPHN|nr:DNA repair protein RecO [Parerythrobacter jejuensis]MXP32776.1 DNA repair protein RecO [Parerythrobacter jejuensis]